jgi:hypothetical protein
MISQQLIEDIQPPSARRYWEKTWRELEIGLARYAQRRYARKLVVGQAFGADVNKFAGSFESFQRQLQREHRRLAQRPPIQETSTFDEYLMNFKEGG